jgi:hypothetical protein
VSPTLLTSDGSTSDEVIADGWLLMRHAGNLWGLQRSALHHLVRSPSCESTDISSWVELRSGEIFPVDEILALATRLETHPVPPAARPYLTGLGGLALWEDQPVALLKPGAPLPPCFHPSSRSDARISPRGADPATSEKALADEA